MRIGRVLAIHLVKTAAGGKKMERLIEHQEWFGQCIDNRQGEAFGLCLVFELPHGDLSSGGAAASDWPSEMGSPLSASRLRAESSSLGWITNVRVDPGRST